MFTKFNTNTVMQSVDYKTWTWRASTPEDDKKTKKSSAEASRSATEIPLATQHFNKIAEEKRARKITDAKASLTEESVPLAIKHFNKIRKKQNAKKGGMSSSLDAPVPLAMQHVKPITEEKNVPSETRQSDTAVEDETTRKAAVSSQRTEGPHVANLAEAIRHCKCGGRVLYDRGA